MGEVEHGNSAGSTVIIQPTNVDAPLIPAVIHGCESSRSWQNPRLMMAGSVPCVWLPSPAACHLSEAHPPTWDRWTGLSSALLNCGPCKSSFSGIDLKGKTYAAVSTLSFEVTRSEAPSMRFAEVRQIAKRPYVYDVYALRRTYTNSMRGPLEDVVGLIFESFVQRLFEASDPQGLLVH